jgi:creatinine amidohydrolase/Fe(II)-dependent formamide hydrolase-like protein
MHWEERIATEFVQAIHQSGGTCWLPFGILEKHCPHLPIGTDFVDVRHAALNAADGIMPWFSRNIILARSSKRSTSRGTMSGK